MVIFTQSKAAPSAYQLVHIATKSTFMMTTVLIVDKVLSSTKKELFVFRVKKKFFIVMKMMMTLMFEFIKEVIGLKMER